jgi:hypothetical protein
MNSYVSQQPCPSDELLASWIERRVRADERDAVERHVAECTTCSDVVGAALAPADQPLARRVARTSAVPQATRRRSPAAPGRSPAVRWAVAAGLMLATAALAYAALDAGLARVRDELARRAGVALGQPVVIGRLGFGLTPDLHSLVLRARDVRVGGDDGLAAEGIEVRLSLTALAARTLQVERVRLLGPVIHVGGTAPTGSGASAGHIGGANVVAAALGTAPLEIIEGTLVADLPGTVLRIEHLAGTATPDHSRVQISLAGSTAGGTVSVNGDIPAGSSGDLSLSFSGRGLDVAALPFARDRLTGNADLSMWLAGTTDAPTAGGRALVRGGRARGWNPFPQALSALDGNGAIRARFPAVAETDLTFDELRVAVMKAPRDWRIPRLYVTSNDFIVGGALQIEGDQSLSGTATVQLAAPLAAAVVAASPALGAARADDLTLTLPLDVTGSLAAPRLALAADAAPAAVPAPEPGPVPEP